MDFISFCRAHGIVIDALPVFGVWRRYKTETKPQHRNGAVKYMGDHGFVQDHATMMEVAVWHADDASAAVKRDEAAERKRRDDEAKRRYQAIVAAREFWDAAKPLNRLHPYLERKGLSPLGCAGLRGHDGLLVIPVMNISLVSVQTINPDGTKRFWTGAPVKAGAYVLPRKPAAVTVLVEGLATGLAIYQSMPMASVVVAFDAGNLLPVAQRIKPIGSVVVAADNDHGTEARQGVNPGLEKAKAVAEFLGCGMAYPIGIEGTDWADALKEWGANSAKRIQREVLAGAKYVT